MSLVPEPTYPTEQEWYAFLTDHLSYITQSANTIILEQYEMKILRSSFMAFLNQYQIPFELFWLILRMNHTDSVRDFPMSATVKVPDMDIIANLYNQYQETKLATTVNG